MLLFAAYRFFRSFFHSQLLTSDIHTHTDTTFIRCKTHKCVRNRSITCIFNSIHSTACTTNAVVVFFPYAAHQHNHVSHAPVYLWNKIRQDVYFLRSRSPFISIPLSFNVSSNSFVVSFYTFVDFKIWSIFMCIAWMKIAFSFLPAENKFLSWFISRPFSLTIKLIWKLLSKCRDRKRERRGKA